MRMMLLKRPETGLQMKTHIFRRCPSVHVCHFRTMNGYSCCHYLLTSLVKFMFSTQINMIMMAIEEFCEITGMTIETSGFYLIVHHCDLGYVSNSTQAQAFVCLFCKKRGVRLDWWYSKGISQWTLFKIKQIKQSSLAATRSQAMEVVLQLCEVSLQPSGTSGSGKLKRGEKILITLAEAGLRCLRLSVHPPSPKGSQGCQPLLFGREEQG